MSAIFGSSQQPKKPAATGLQIQTSSNHVPVPIQWGQGKLAPNIVWYNDFKVRKVKVGGKGGGSSKQYQYSASIILALCEGPVDDISDVWRDLYSKQIYSLFATKYASAEFLGSYSQTPWSYVTTTHPTEALAYRGVAYIGIPNYDLGPQPQVPQHNVTVNGILYETAVNGTTPDAEPAALVEDFLTNVNYGTPFRPSALDNDTLFSGPDATTTGDSAYETYCRAMGFGLSPTLVDAEQASAILERWLKITNTAPVWSGDKLKFIPYGDEDITANGVTFLAPTTVQYDLTMADFIYEQGEDPVKFERVDPSDVKNALFVEILDRANQFNLKPVPARDQASIEKYGLKQGETFKAHEVKDLQMADTVAHLMLQRNNYVLNTYRFTLGQRFARLEAMDTVTLTVPLLGMELYRVRVLEVNENDDGAFEIVAEDFPEGVGTTGTYATQPTQGVVYNAASDPGDIEAPIIFEPPVALSNSVSQFWIGATGVGEFWGGCDVWFSTDDTNFYQIGSISNDVRMGVLTAALASYGGMNPDTMNTLAVDLASSLGELDSADAGDAANGLTACLVNDEILSYEDATPTGTYEYDLDTLYRGLYASPIGSHNMGDPFLRLDSAVFKYDLDPAYIGQTVYFKFPSFNIWGESTQDLSDVSSYPYTVQGTAYAIAPPTNLSAVGGAGGITLDWDASPSSLVSGYKIYAVNNHTGTFGMATLIATVGGGTTNFFHGGLPSMDDWRYWVTAFNSYDESTEDGPEDATTT